MCDNLPHLNDLSLPVCSESQEEQTCQSVDHCPLSSSCHCCNNYTFDHLSKSSLLRMRTCCAITEEGFFVIKAPTAITEHKKES